MKTIITTIAATLLTASVSAADVYHGLDEGNSDLSNPRVSAEDHVGVQPGIGDSIDRYHGWADGNPDLFSAKSSDRADSGEDPNIYMGFAGSPDLQF